MSAALPYKMDASSLDCLKSSCGGRMTFGLRHKVAGQEAERQIKDDDRDDWVNNPDKGLSIIGQVELIP